MSATGELRRPEAAELPPPPGWPGLLRTAHLLTADHGAAEELAVAALVRAGRRWAGRAAPDAHRLVLTMPASPVRWFTSPPARAGTGPEDPFLRAYRALPPRGRALLVLRVADGLDERAAARAVGVPAARARAETVTALDALRAPLADRTAAGAPDAARAAPAIELDLDQADRLDPADPVVRTLGRLYADLEAHPPVTTRPGERVARATARDRARRRTAAALAAVVVVLAATGGALVARQHARDEAARELAVRQQALDALLHPLVLGADLSTWPTRGSHAGDAALLAQVRRRVGDGVALPFVGRVGDLDMALVYAGTSDNPRLYVLHGPPDSDPAGWAEDDGVPPASDAAVLSAAVRDGAGLVHLVVATLSRGVSAAYSPERARSGTTRPSRGSTGRSVSRTASGPPWRRGSRAASRSGCSTTRTPPSSPSTSGRPKRRRPIAPPGPSACPFAGRGRAQVSRSPTTPARWSRPHSSRPASRRPPSPRSGNSGATEAWTGRVRPLRSRPRTAPTSSATRRWSVLTRASASSGPAGPFRGDEA